MVYGCYGKRKGEFTPRFIARKVESQRQADAIKAFRLYGYMCSQHTVRRVEALDYIKRYRQNPVEMDALFHLTDRGLEQHARKRGVNLCLRRELKSEDDSAM